MEHLLFLATLFHNRVDNLQLKHESAFSGGGQQLNRLWIERKGAQVSRIYHGNQSLCTLNLNVFMNGHQPLKSHFLVYNLWGIVLLTIY